MEVTRAMRKHEDGATLNGVALSDLLGAVLRVEHNYVTLRKPEGWLLWSQKVTSETDLKSVIEQAAINWNYNQGTYENYVAKFYEGEKENV